MSESSCQSLTGKHVILGVSGGIAAYKAADLARRLIKAGAEVQVVMTRAAHQFVSPLTFQALTGRPVRSETFDYQAEAAMGHIELARWADVVLVAPATAHVMAQIANGMAGDLLTTLCLATPAPLFLAPAMNQQMWRQDSTRENVRRLLAQNVTLLGPASGSQACGDVGPGRMEEPDVLVESLEAWARQRQHLKGCRVVVTAGPTREPLDPVRFLSNHSTGKMGYAMARAFAEAGADVTLVSGPVTLDPPAGVERVMVSTAVDMHQAVQACLQQARVDWFVGCAAVADYRPAEVAPQKIKKGDHELALTLVRNPDIISEVARSSLRPARVVGFAAETEQVEGHALKKLTAKGLDWICANRVGQGMGFARDDNRILLLGADGTSREFGPDRKISIARQLVEFWSSRQIEPPSA